MLRAAGLLRLLSGIQRFSTSGHPEALVACYVAAWPQPVLIAGLSSSNLWLDCKGAITPGSGLSFVLPHAGIKCRKQA